MLSSSFVCSDLKVTERPPFGKQLFIRSTVNSPFDMIYAVILIIFHFRFEGNSLVLIS